MTAPRGELSPLRRLDDEVVPAAAARLQRTLATVGRWWRSRLAATGLVRGVVRREPTLVASILAVLVASVLVAVAGGHPGGSGSSKGGGPPSVAVASLGPLPGTSVSDYLRNASLDLRHFGETARGRSTYAVVDLGSYLTPAQATATFLGVDVVRVYVRVPNPRLPTQVHSVPVRGIGDLRTQLRTTAAIATATARSYAVLVADLHPHSREDRILKAKYADQQRAAAFEARVLVHGDQCACVFAAVVHADPAQLGTLAHAPGVRVVDPAPPTVMLGALSVFPLEPEITTVVPKTGLVGG